MSDSPKPIAGSTMSGYCDCANKKSGYQSIHTTWVCKGKMVKTGWFAVDNIIS